MEQSNLSSVATFIQMFDNFLNELTETFPSQKHLKSMMKKYELFKGTNDKKTLDIFVSTFQPYHDYIMNKDETLMLMEHESGMLKDLKIAEIWKSDECTSQNKEAIWAHLSSLYMFATTINMIPSNLMNGIEQLAQQYASSIDENALKDFKPDMLMNNMASLMKKLG